MKLPRRALATLCSTGLAAAAVAAGVASAPAAHAAPQAVDDATLTWAVNDEVNAGAFAPGTWNLMSAGLIGDPGAGGTTLTSGNDGATWSNGTPAGWDSTVGNVTVEDEQVDGTWAPATFQGTRTNAAGQTTSATSSSVLAGTRLSLTNGTGTVDPDAGTASLTWDGDATVLFYSGMTYFTLSDPTLTVQAGGAATLTATAGGYATEMDDPTAWTALPATTVTLASMSGVEVTADGFTATPAYDGVEYDAADDETPQDRTRDGWGAFPTDFVRFQQSVGQGPYWYSTGGSADARKAASPITLSIGEPAEPVAPATVTVSDTELSTEGTQQVTVTGSGFDPALATGARPPLAGRPAGAYVVFGRFADVWRPSEGAASTTRSGSQKATRWAVLAEDMTTIGGAARGAIELRPDGTFTTTLDVSQADLAAVTSGRYGIYTYAGGGAVQALYETYTPLTFTAPTTPEPTPTTPPVVAPVTPAAPAAPVRQATTTKAEVAKRPTAARPGRARITVPGVTSGTVRTVLRGVKGTKVATRTRSATVSNGVATVSVPRLRRGTYRLVVRYAGTSTTLPSRTTTTIRVR